MRRYYEQSNILRTKLKENQFLISTHRGKSGGDIIENSVEAKVAAYASGTDIVEIDVASSIDDINYVFHDGNESKLLRYQQNILGMTSPEIDNLFCYSECGSKLKRHLPKLNEFLSTIKESDIINIDRGWVASKDFLDTLDQFNIVDNVILKCKINDIEYLKRINNHPVKYMFIVILEKPEDIDLILEYEDINLIGIEPIAKSETEVLNWRNVIKKLKQEDFLIMLNAEVVSKNNLYGGYDDTVSVLNNPDNGWGRLVGEGADIIITDWPHLLKQFRDSL